MIQNDMTLLSMVLATQGLMQCMKRQSFSLKIETLCFSLLFSVVQIEKKLSVISIVAAKPSI